MADDCKLSSHKDLESQCYLTFLTRVEHKIKYFGLSNPEIYTILPDKAARYPVVRFERRGKKKKTNFDIFVGDKIDYGLDVIKRKEIHRIFWVYLASGYRFQQPFIFVLLLN